ncbi:hypothetical protein KCU92_g9848, partial [Aureobasidium melanogenum]
MDSCALSIYGVGQRDVSAINAASSCTRFQSKSTEIVSEFEKGEVLEDKVNRYLILIGTKRIADEVTIPQNDQPAPSSTVFVSRSRVRQSHCRSQRGQSA